MTATTARDTMARSLFLLMLWLSTTTVSWSQETEAQECVVGDDGECIVTEETQQPVGKESRDDEFVECVDSTEECAQWAEMMECSKNPKYMLHNCVKSCGMCDKTKEEIDEKVTADIKKKRQQELRAKDLPNYDFGAAQEITKGNSAADVGVKMWKEQTENYIRDYVIWEDAIRDKLDRCRNFHASCSRWASQGECNKNPGYMFKECLPACRMCHKVLLEDDDDNAQKDAQDDNRVDEPGQ